MIAFVVDSGLIRLVNADLVVHIFSSMGSPRPRALAGVTPIDLRMAAGDHGLLDVRPFDVQLRHGAVVSVGRDSSDAR